MGLAQASLTLVFLFVSSALIQVSIFDGAGLLSDSVGIWTLFAIVVAAAIFSYFLSKYADSRISPSVKEYTSRLNGPGSRVDDYVISLFAPLMSRGAWFTLFGILLFGFLISAYLYSKTF